LWQIWLIVKKANVYGGIDKPTTFEKRLLNKDEPKKLYAFADEFKVEISQFSVACTELHVFKSCPFNLTAIVKKTTEDIALLQQHPLKWINPTFFLTKRINSLALNG